MRVLKKYVLLIMCSGFVVAAPKNDTVMEASESKITSSEQTKDSENTTSKSAQASAFYPHWVPFDNKNIDELGEFVRSKPKPKKRLALPTNFIMKSPADIEDEDYYDKHGEQADYAQQEIADNDGKEVIDDIPKKVSLPLNSTKNKAAESSDEIHKKEHKEEESESRNDQRIAQVDSKHDNDHDHRGEDDHNDSREDKSDHSHDRDTKHNINDKKQDEHNDDASNDENSREQKSDKSKDESGENGESEEKDDEEDEEPKHVPTAEEIFKRQIVEAEKKRERERVLASVDKLKEQHKQQLKQIKERAHIEEQQDEDQEDNIKTKQLRQKLKYPREYGHRIGNLKRGNKRWHVKEQDNDSDSTENKENVSASDERSAEVATVRKKATGEDDKYHKESVKDFNKYRKHAHLKPKNTIQKDKSEEIDSSEYIETTTAKLPKALTSRPSAFSVTTAPEAEENLRISLNPGRAIRKTGKKNKKGHDGDSSTSETVADAATSIDAVKVVADAVVAASNHGGNSEHKKGGGKEHHSHHHSETGEKGHKGYKGHHSDLKKAEGHHDKEGHKGEYLDHGGHDKHHHDESGHHGEHHKAEKGKKHAEYEESGKHSKGHNTKGSHDIHKKEEYEKNVEFFEEDGDSSDEEKHGGFHEHHEHAKGGKHHGSELHGGHQHKDKGETAHFEKGKHHDHLKGHKHSDGHQNHHVQNHGHGSKHGKGLDKKWTYHHGHPAKTAHLVAVDKRSDRLVGYVPYY